MPTHSIHPADFTIAPVGAIDKLLSQVGWSKDDVDLFEINEAFAMVTMLAISELGLDPDKVNIYGGACAQGHPIGSTGSRLLVTLAHALKATGGNKGVSVALHRRRRGDRHGDRTGVKATAWSYNGPRPLTQYPG